jgi:drug/metabolite transporter (DMT)-like permease
MAIGSGVAIGAFFVTIDQTSEQSGVVPLLLNRAVTATIMFAAVGVLALVAARRRRDETRGAAASVDDSVDGRMPRAAGGTVVAPTRSPTAAGVRLAILGGAVDVTAYGLLLIGIRAGELSVAAVLGAMYPAGTILLAALVLKERIAPVQWFGLVLALAAAGMLALA